MFLKLWGWSEWVHTNHAQELHVTVVNLHESRTVSVLSKCSIEDFPSLHVQGTGSTSLWVDVNVGHYRVEDTNHLLNTFYYISCLNRRDPSGILFTIKISSVCFSFCSFSSFSSLLAEILLALLSLLKTCCEDASQMFNA